MGFFEGILDAVNLRDDDDYEDDYDDEEEVDEPSRFSRKSRESKAAEKKTSNITPSQLLIMIFRRLLIHFFHYVQLSLILKG